MIPSPPVHRRPVAESDRDFLLALYASTRAHEMQLVPWTPEDKAAFLEMQFRAQDQFYRQNYPEARYDVLEIDGQPAGRLYVDSRSEEIRIIDIAIVPAQQSRGIGTQLLRELQDAAAASGRAVTIHVDLDNRALRFYERLGFRGVEQRGGYLFMQWRAAGEM